MTSLDVVHPFGEGAETGTAPLGNKSNPVGNGRLRVRNLNEILRCYFGISSSSEFKYCTLLHSWRNEMQLKMFESNYAKNTERYMKIIWTTVYLDMYED